MRNGQNHGRITEVAWDRFCRFSVAVFPTEFGWFGLWGRDDTVAGLAIGHSSRVSVLRTVTDRLGGQTSRAREEAGTRVDASRPNPLPHGRGSLRDREFEWDEADWHPELRRRLQEYALGQPDDFQDVTVALPPRTAFQHDVLCATRRIGCGETRSYAELAADAGHHGAARAVGNVMRTNRIPVIIPCHRVVASGGKWGGFSAPQGVDLKRRMLEVEAGVPV